MKHHLVNGDAVLPSEVLEDGRQEGLREEEATEPERFRFALLDPSPEKLDPVGEIRQVLGQRALARVRDFSPVGRNGSLQRKIVIVDRNHSTKLTMAAVAQSWIKFPQKEFQLN